MAKPRLKAYVQCRKCKRTLSLALDEVPYYFEPDWPDGATAIPQGQFWIARGTPGGINGHILIHLDDRVGLSYHPDRRRHNGCCGRDGCDGPNQVCACGEEVATEVSDCWTSSYAHFERHKVTLKRYPLAPGTEHA